MSQSTNIATGELEAIVASAFVASDTDPAVAATVARALTLAEIDGRKGHGLARVPSYSAQARSGKVDGHAAPRCEQTRAGALIVDACHGFAYPAFDLALERLPQMVHASGIAAAAITRSHHFGVAGHQVERLSELGMVGLVFGNTPKAIAPWGGRKGVFGTNPIAFAAPRRDAPSIVIDLALSEVARGNILKAQQAGTSIPQDWAFDEDGRPTSDPDRALEGTMRPLGGAKGAALAFMVEVLAAALTGSHLAGEASSFFTAEGPPPAVGQLLIGIDPTAFAGGEVFAERLESLVNDIERQEGTRLPGHRRLELRDAASRDGINVDTSLLREIKVIAGG